MILEALSSTLYNLAAEERSDSAAKLYKVEIIGRKHPISKLPRMSFGSMPNDGGYLILNTNEYTDLLRNSPMCKQFVREAVGAREYINCTRPGLLTKKPPTLY